MDIGAIVPWLSAVALLISIGTAFTTYFRAGSKEAAAKLVDHDRRIQELENEMKHLPDKDAVHRLELVLAEMRTELVKVASSADQSARGTARVEAYLMERGR